MIPKIIHFVRSTKCKKNKKTTHQAYKSMDVQQILMDAHYHTQQPSNKTHD
jgi:hypothetical protein